MVNRSVPHAPAAFPERIQGNAVTFATIAGGGPRRSAVAAFPEASPYITAWPFVWEIGAHPPHSSRPEGLSRAHMFKFFGVKVPVRIL